MKPSAVIWIRSGFGLALALLLGGCSTPVSRIKRQPELFASYPAETQTLIREGKVGIGFDEQMVRMAVGEPDRKWSRVDAEGEREIWAFTRFESADGLPLYRGSYHRLYDPLYPHFEYSPVAKAREYFRVVFAAGKVVSVESDSLP